MSIQEACGYSATVLGSIVFREPSVGEVPPGSSDVGSFLSEVFNFVSIVEVVGWFGESHVGGVTEAHVLM